MLRCKACVGEKRGAGRRIAAAGFARTMELIIMAYLSGLRERSRRSLLALPRRSAAALRRIATCVPGACALCMARVHGGRLCAVCADMATATMRDGRPRCPRCAVGVDQAGVPCMECRIAPPAFERIVAAFDYAPPGDVLIRQWKVDLRYTHVRLLGNLVEQAVRDARLRLPASTILAAVPSSAPSIRRRGFNPAAELARQLAGALSLPLRSGLLQRGPQGDKQAALPRSERIRNVVGLYHCTQALQGRTVLVVDDVLTTGATVDAVARSLKAAGAERVLGVVAARAP